MLNVCQPGHPQFLCSTHRSQSVIIADHSACLQPAYLRDFGLFSEANSGGLLSSPLF